MMGFCHLVCTKLSDVLRPPMAVFVTQVPMKQADCPSTLQQCLSMRLEFYLFNQKVKIGSFKKYLI